MSKERELALAAIERMRDDKNPERHLAGVKETAIDTFVKGTYVMVRDSGRTGYIQDVDWSGNSIEGPVLVNFGFDSAWHKPEDLKVVSEQASRDLSEASGYSRTVAVELIEAAKLGALACPTPTEETQDAAEQLLSHVTDAIRSKALEHGFTLDQAETVAYAISGSLVVSRALESRFATEHAAEWVGEPLTEEQEAEAERVAKLQRSIGERVRRLRQSMGMTMGTVAVSLGIRVSDVSNIERGIAAPQMLTRAYSHLLQTSLSGAPRPENTGVLDKLKKQGGIQLSRKYRSVALMPAEGLFKALKKHLPRAYAEVQQSVRAFARSAAIAAFGANPKALDVYELSPAEWAEWEELKRRAELARAAFPFVHSTRTSPKG